MKHRVTVEFDQFGWEVLTEEAERQQVSIEDLLLHAAAYYMNGVVSDPVATRVPLRRPADGESAMNRRFRRPLEGEPEG